MNEPDLIRTLLTAPTTIAVIGLSDNPVKPSHYVSAYMQRQGFKIYPINPLLTEVLGEPAFPTITALHEAGIKPNLVNVFRTPNYIPAIVEEMLTLSLHHLWVQQGIVNEEAAAHAESSGIQVVMDRCLMIEHRHLATLQAPVAL